uniref:Leucine-rich immune protein (Short) n=1 Tax=Anopheles stephensi TaxID=30069 RepID=A0A182XWK7_ANOST
MDLSCSIIHSLPIGSERYNFNARHGTPVRSQQTYVEVCIIASVNLNSTDTEVTFPKHQHIELFYPSIPTIGSNFFRQLGEVTLNLELRKGNLSELLFGESKLNHLKIGDTGLSRFEVVDEYDSNLQTLIIHERLITVLPTRVNLLRELRSLDLSGCSLTIVDLSQLNGLNLLNALVLADNQLSSVEDGGVGVNLPALNKFDVQQNELSRIDRFPEMFPALKFTRIMQNRWDCEWVSEVRDKIWRKNITVLGTDFRCGRRINNGGLCCTYAHPFRARLAIAKAMLSVLDELSATSTGDGTATQSIDPLITFKVYENETVDGVIGVETQNVGIYLQNPIGVVLLVVIPCSLAIIKRTIECSRVQRNSTCFIEGVSFHTPTEEYFTAFPTSPHIIIESSEILHFSGQLFDALAETAFLTLKGSLIPTVTFRSDELHCLRIDNTGLREFAVTPFENRNLNTLIINGNPLSAIPSTVRYLTGLSILDLSNNQLEHVKLDWFQTMENLLVLDLSGNRITRLDIPPSLRFGRLKNFWVNHNLLRHVPFFPNFAPALRRVRLVENRWSCEWVAQVRQAIWTASIEVYGAEYVCPDKLDGGLCCYEDYLYHGTDIEVEHEARRTYLVDRIEVEQFPRAERMLARDENREERQHMILKHSFDVLEQKYRRLVEQKEQLEQRFVNTVRELERTVKRLTAELTEAQDTIRAQNLKIVLR